MEIKKGKFIVLYGINNLGKTTQAKMLVDRLKNCGYKAEYIKYPIYDLEPAGLLLNNFYRHGNPYNFSDRESQLLHYTDRISFEPLLKNKLNKGINIIAEDYFGTAVAWGSAAGTNNKLLKYLYSFLYPEDLSFLFDGTRFRDAIENDHYHETNFELSEKSRLAHIEIGMEYGWYKINANLPIMEINEILWHKVKNLLEKPANYFIAPNFKELHDQIYINNQPESMEKLKYTETENKKIIIRRLSPLAVLPKKDSAEDSGYNLFASEYLPVQAGKKITVKTGIKILIPPGYIGLIWNKNIQDNDGLHVFATIIDGKFKDEIIINAMNTSKIGYKIYPGMKIAKLYFKKMANLEIIESEIN
jgi:thymidylate kinase/dUTPase